MRRHPCYMFCLVDRSPSCDLAYRAVPPRAGNRVKRSERRRFLFAACAYMVVPMTAFAQSRERLWRVGFLALRRPVSLGSDQFGAFLYGMRELGYVEGKNLVVEWRFADGRSDRLQALAAELVGLKVDAILAAGTQAISATRHATTTVPIVMAGANDPVGSGFVTSLARPGGNVTGLSLLLDDVTPKQLEMLLAVMPRLARVALLANPANVSYVTLEANVQVAARRAGIEVLPVHARTPEEIDVAFAGIARDGAGAIIVASDALFTQQMRQIAALAEKNRLPSIAPFRQYVEAGALMSYGQDFTEHFRRTAAYVDKVLKGAKPGDLPIEQPTKFELVINMKTAKALGLTIPQSLLLRAADIIQ